MLESRRLPFGLTPAVLILSLAPVVSAQEGGADTGTDTEQELAALRAHYDELQLRIAELEARDRVQGDALEEEYADDELDLGSGLYFHAGEVNGTFLVFGDVDATYQNPRDGGNSEFSMGDLDVLGNINLGEHWRVLSETVIDVDKVGQERLWGQYTVSDALYFKLGTEHSPISRWNYEFHHGAWLETTIDRPILARFEGDNGILPMHRTGLETGGRAFTDDGSFQYFATISNGRGEQPNDKQRETDANDSKAIDTGINYYPASHPSMTFGAALVYDEIPSDGSSTDPDRSRNMTEWIATANFSSGIGPLFLRSEYAFILHEGKETNTNYNHNTGFVQLELPGELWTPYTRAGYRNMTEGDPFYEPLDRDLNEWRETLGVRADFNPNVAMKFEVSYGRKDERDGSDVSSDDVTSAGIQLAWHF